MAPRTPDAFVMLHTASWILLALYGLIVLRWLWGHVELTRAARARLMAPAAPSVCGGSAPSVTVVIAAHNEADTIGRCLERVLAQDCPSLQVIVANDRSTDATGQILRTIAREHSNLRCIEIDMLPEGWLGKTHAVSVATREAAGEYLVFTDSDVDWHPATLALAVNLAEGKRLDFLSLWPTAVVSGFWERLLLPACGWALSLWFHGGEPDRLESTPAFANGAFLMVRRDAYERIGGHASVPDAMAEDVALAQRARDAGLRRYLALGGDLVRTRMYADLDQVIQGWTRIFIGALGARSKMVATIMMAFIGCLSSFVVLGVLVAWVATGHAFGPIQCAWLAAAVAHLAAMYSVVYRNVALVFEGRTYVLLFPMAILGVVCLLVRCLLLSLGVGTVRWGNVRYRVRGGRAVGRTMGDHDV
jgi:cellulose synthase/poly-beta-1,6-N-acetylglucosamine synthase-like glycosyltransferase